MLNVAYNVVLPVFLIAGVSALIHNRLKLDVRSLSSLIIYVCSPALVLDSIANTDLNPGQIGEIGVIVFLVASIVALLALGVSRLMKWDRKLESAFIMTSILINAGNFGLPLSEFAFGAAGLGSATVYYVMTAILSNTFGVFLASRGNASAREAFLNVFRVPILYGMLIGLFVNFTNTTLPAPIARAVHLVGQSAVPIMLVVLGIQLSQARLKGRWLPVGLASGMRLIVAPLVAAGVALLFGLDGLTRNVVIVQSGMPTAVLSSVLAEEFGADGEFTSATILVSTLASLFTLSVLMALLGV